MPQLNQRGPDGQGPMTGRIIGRCTNFGANLKKQSITSSDTQIEDQSENFRGRGAVAERGMGCKGRGKGLGFQNRHHAGK